MEYYSKEGWKICGRENKNTKQSIDSNYNSSWNDLFRILWLDLLFSTSKCTKFAK